MVWLRRFADKSAGFLFCAEMCLLVTLGSLRNDSTTMAFCVRQYSPVFERARAGQMAWGKTRTWRRGAERLGLSADSASNRRYRRLKQITIRYNQECRTSHIVMGSSWHIILNTSDMLLTCAACLRYNCSRTTNNWPSRSPGGKAFLGPGVKCAAELFQGE